MDALR